MRFTIYLNEERMLSDRDCMRVLTSLSERTPPLGRVAVRTGVLSVGQLSELLAIQADVSVPLGRLAVAKGMLTEPQLQELVEAQRRTTPSEQQVIADLGLLPPANLDEAHRRFLGRLT